MYLTGFADEAATSIEGQIEATRSLGWRHIEARNVNGKNIHEISDSEFDNACDALEKAGIRINAFGSTIANWGKSILDPQETSMEEARRAIPRMQRLGVKMVRIMSYKVLPDRDGQNQEEAKRFHRLRDLVALFQDAGMTAVHENCMNYGGMGWPFTLRLLDNVPGLKLVFDTGNPVQSADWSKAPGDDGELPRQSAWEFWEQVRDHVVHIHIKDGVWDQAARKVRWTMPGEGQGDVRRICRDLIARGYRDAISIEPHLAVVYHDPTVTATEEIKFRNYVEYGQKMRALLLEVGAEVED